nr:phage tail length tape measure family protein [uncultured Celeribacter sp.]
MSVKQFLVELVFRGNSAGAKAAAQDVQKAVAGVNSETQSGTKTTDQNTTATTKNADAKRRAAEEAKRLADAEKRAREEAHRAGTGVGGGSGASPSQTPVLPQAERDRIKARYNPTFAAQQQYQAQLDEIKSAEKTGALTSDEVAMAQARVRGSYEASLESIKRTDAALTGMNRTVKLQAYEQRMLSYQVSDTFQSFALGMPPMQILLQQGPQVIDIYGGIGNTMRALRQVITPLRVGMLGLGAVVVAGVSSWNAYLKSIKEVETAYDGLGRGLASSTSQLEAQARAGAVAAGISTKAARSMEAQFLRTAKIGADHYDDMIGMSKDFAATLGVEMDAIGGIMAEMFSDPAKGADTLYRKYGLIDAATMRYAQTLAAQNREGDAQAALLDALPDKLADAEKALTGFQRAREKVGNVLGDIGDTWGQSIDGMFGGKQKEPTAEEMLQYPWLQPDVIDQKLNSSNPLRVEDGLRAMAERDALQVRAERERREIEEKARRDEAERQGKFALGIAEGSGATATSRREEELRNQIAALEAGVGAPGLDQFQQDEITEALEAKTRVLDALTNKQARLNELDRLDAQIAAERNPVLRADLEARRTRLQLADQEISAAELEAEASRARQKIIEQTILTAQSQVSDMQAEVEIRARLDAQVATGIIKSEDVNRLLQEELTLRPLVAAAAAAEGEEKARLNGVIESMRKAYSDQAAADKTADRTSKLRDYLKTQQESAAQLRLELSLIGQSEAIRSRTLALFEAEKKIRELGLSGKAADQIREEAAQMVDLERQVDRVGEAWERVQSSGEDALDALLDGDFTGALDGLREQFMDLAINNPLKNALLGTDYGTLSDLGGLQGIWDRLTGKVTIDPASAAREAAQSVGMMQVTAGSVTISSMGDLGLGAMGAVAANRTDIPSSILTPSVTSFDGTTLALSAQDIIDLKKTVATEWVQSSGEAQAAGIIDTILNRVASGKWGGSVASVVDAKSQFSDVNGPVAWASGRSSVDDIPMSRITSRIDEVVDSWLMQRAAGARSSIGGNLNYANPNYSDASNLSWINSLSGPVLGAGSAIHQHGTTADLQSWMPNAFAISLPSTLLQTEQSLNAFSQSILTTGTDLSTLGGGFDSFGQTLATALQNVGGGGDIWSSLFNIGLGALGLPGFAVGGDTGGSDPTKVAGLVHEKEYVFDAASTARIGVQNLEAIRRGTMRGYASGGYATAQSYPFLTQGRAANSNASFDSRPIIQITNNSSAQVDATVEESTDARGQRSYKLVMSDAVATGLSARGGKASQSLQSGYGVKRRGVSRL